MDTGDFLLGFMSAILATVVGAVFLGIMRKMHRNCLRRNIEVVLLDRPQRYSTKYYWTAQVSTHSNFLYRYIPLEIVPLQLSTRIKFREVHTDKTCMGVAYNADLDINNKEIRFNLTEQAPLEIAIYYRLFSTRRLYPIRPRGVWELLGDWDIEIMLQEDNKIIFRKLFPNAIVDSNPNKAHFAKSND